MFQYEKQSPVGPEKKGKGEEKEKDLFVVIALKARISKVKTQICKFVCTFGDDGRCMPKPRRCLNCLQYLQESRQSPNALD